jgi:hypothetical protein
MAVPRGAVLKRIGTTRRLQFRAPLMPTYVLMRGRFDGHTVTTIRPQLQITTVNFGYVFSHFDQTVNH